MKTSGKMKPNRFIHHYFDFTVVVLICDVSVVPFQHNLNSIDFEENRVTSSKLKVYDGSKVNSIEIDGNQFAVR